VARALGAEFEPTRFLTTISEADRAWAAARLAGVARPRLVVNVGARWVTKRWPPASFAAVARRAAVERGAGIVAVGAPEDRPLVDAFVGALGDDVPALDLCAATTLPRLAAVLGAAEVVLSNDTGPLHLAVAAGARTVAVFTCTSPIKTGPYSARAEVVATGVGCAASCVKACGHLSCMAELGPERVWAAVRRQLDAAASESRGSAA
jgi:ADP-heptose:LPS heptosyltransferase